MYTCPWNRTKHTKHAGKYRHEATLYHFQKAVLICMIPNDQKKAKVTAILKKKINRNSRTRSRELRATKAPLSPEKIIYLASPHEIHFYACEGQKGDWEQSAQIYKIAPEQHDYLL